jgi:hypothetical protein
MRPKPCHRSKVRAEARSKRAGGAPSCSWALWAAEQFGRAELGDKRLTARLVVVGAALGERPADSVPQASGSWAATKGAYRLIENKRVRKEPIFQSVSEATAGRCAGRRVVYSVQDTTDLTFPTAREAAAQMGYVNDSDIGAMHLHSALALDEDGVALGLLDAQIWARDPAERGKKRQRHERPIEEKESAKWLRGIAAVQQAINGAAPAGRRPRVIHIFDREGDIHRVFEDIAKAGDGAVIRAMQDRRVAGGDNGVERAYERLRAQAPLGRSTVAVPRKGVRAGRSATIALRSCQVTLAPGQARNRRNPPVSLWLVEALEENPPAGGEPLHWRLWTTEPAGSLCEAAQVLAIYALRWKIEDYHLALKCGCAVEELRMHTAERIAKTIAIYAPIAARLVELRDRARATPEAPCTDVLADQEWRVLWTMIQKEPPAPDTPVPTIRQAVLWIGRLGGHLGRKGDGMPGVKTLWRGLRDLQLLVHYALVFNP